MFQIILFDKLIQFSIKLLQVSQTLIHIIYPPVYLYGIIKSTTHWLNNHMDAYENGSQVV
jgi:hypothetical protein